MRLWTSSTIPNSSGTPTIFFFSHHLHVFLPSLFLSSGFFSVVTFTLFLGFWFSICMNVMMSLSSHFILFRVLLGLGWYSVFELVGCWEIFDTLEFWHEASCRDIRMWKLTDMGGGIAGFCKVCCCLCWVGVRWMLIPGNGGRILGFLFNVSVCHCDLWSRLNLEIHSILNLFYGMYRYEFFYLNLRICTLICWQGRLWICIETSTHSKIQRVLLYIQGT